MEPNGVEISTLSFFPFLSLVMRQPASSSVASEAVTARERSDFFREGTSVISKACAGRAAAGAPNGSIRRQDTCDVVRLFHPYEKYWKAFCDEGWLLS